MCVARPAACTLLVQSVGSSCGPARLPLVQTARLARPRAAFLRANPALARRPALRGGLICTLSCTALPSCKAPLHAPAPRTLFPQAPLFARAHPRVLHTPPPNPACIAHSRCKPRPSALPIGRRRRLRLHNPAPPLTRRPPIGRSGTASICTSALFPPAPPCTPFAHSPSTAGSSSGAVCGGGGGKGDVRGSPRALWCPTAPPPPPHCAPPAPFARSFAHPAAPACPTARPCGVRTPHRAP